MSKRRKNTPPVLPDATTILPGQPNAQAPNQAPTLRYSAEDVEKQLCGWHGGGRYVAGDPLALPKPQSEPTERFAPFLDRALKGDLRALVEFFHASWADADRDSAFYECVGYLATTGLPEHAKIVRKIMNLAKRGGPDKATPAKLEVAWYWVARLRRPAQDAKHWIRKMRREQGDSVPRPRLWEMYPQRASFPKGLFDLLAQRTPASLSPSVAVRRFAAKKAGISESLLSRKPCAEQ